jgi:hypothetical protein
VHNRSAMVFAQDPVAGHGIGVQTDIAGLTPDAAYKGDRRPPKV